MLFGYRKGLVYAGVGLLGIVVSLVLYPLFARPRSRGFRERRQRVARQQNIHPALLFVRQGMDAVKAGDYAAGKDAFTKAIGIDPSDLQSRLLLADVCERQGQWRDAVQAYQEVLKQPGNSISSDPITHIRYALALLHVDRGSAASTEYTNAYYKLKVTTPLSLSEQDLAPDTASRPRLQAMAHVVLATKRPTYGGTYPELASEDRRRHLNEAIRLQPEWALPYFYYGQELAQSGQLAEARTAYGRADRLATGDLKGQVKQALETLRLREIK